MMEILREWRGEHACHLMGEGVEISLVERACMGLSAACRGVGVRGVVVYLGFDPLGGWDVGLWGFYSNFGGVWGGWLATTRQCWGPRWRSHIVRYAMPVNSRATIISLVYRYCALDGVPLTHIVSTCWGARLCVLGCRRPWNVAGLPDLL